MGEIAGKYAGAFTLAVRAALEYRLNLLASLLGAVSPAVVQIALWTRLYASPAGHGGVPAGAGVRLFGFSYAEMLGYVVVANIVSCMVRTGFEYELNDDIHGGGLECHLAKPIDYFGARVAHFLGAKAAESLALFLVLLLALGVLARTIGFGGSTSDLFGFVAALGLALVLNFLVFWCVGLLGFWLTEVGFLFEAARIVLIAASGGIFPLAVLGPRAGAVLGVMPFRFIIQFPTDVLCGRIGAAQLSRGLGLGGLWCLVMAGLGRVLWNAGLRRFPAPGSR